MFYLVPILTVIITSFTRWNGYNIPEFTGLNNYIKLFQTKTFLISLKNLLLWSLIAATAHVGFGVLVAFLLYRQPIGWKFVRAVFMIPNVISVAAWAMIYKFIFHNDFGLLNNILRIFIPNLSIDWFYQSPAAFWAITFTWLFYAVVVTLIVLGDLMAIPTELHEAAFIDGATNWQVTMNINLPLCRNSISTSIILSMTARVAMYETIILTSRGGPGDDTTNLPLILVRAIQDMNYGYANAVAMIMILIGITMLVGINALFEERD
jgi:raffinose/stachyose/melibiose transport system permease protein